MDFYQLENIFKYSFIYIWKFILTDLNKMSQLFSIWDVHEKRIKIWFRVHNIERTDAE